MKVGIVFWLFVGDFNNIIKFFIDLLKCFFIYLEIVLNIFWELFIGVFFNKIFLIFLFINLYFIDFEFVFWVIFLVGFNKFFKNIFVIWIGKICGKKFFWIICIIGRYIIGVADNKFVNFLVVGEVFILKWYIFFLGFSFLILFFGKFLDFILNLLGKINFDVKVLGFFINIWF